jgi:hypothetical protein
MESEVLSPKAVRESKTGPPASVSPEAQLSALCLSAELFSSL